MTLPEKKNTNNSKMTFPTFPFILIQHKDKQSAFLKDDRNLLISTVRKLKNVFFSLCRIDFETHALFSLFQIVAC